MLIVRKIIISILIPLFTLGFTGVNITEHLCNNCGISDIHLYNINSCDTHHDHNTCNTCEDNSHCSINKIDNDSCCKYENNLLQIVIPLTLSKLKIAFNTPVFEIINLIFIDFFIKLEPDNLLKQIQPPNYYSINIDIFTCKFNL